MKTIYADDIPKRISAPKSRLPQPRPKKLAYVNAAPFVEPGRLKVLSPPVEIVKK